MLSLKTGSDYCKEPLFGIKLSHYSVSAYLHCVHAKQKEEHVTTGHINVQKRYVHIYKFKL